MELEVLSNLLPVVKHQNDTTMQIDGDFIQSSEIPKLIKCRGPCNLEYHINKIKKVICLLNYSQLKIFFSLAIFKTAIIS